MNWDNILAFALKHRDEDVHGLALKAKAFPEIDMPMVLQQVAGYKIAVSKLPAWAAQNDIVYGPQLAMEQCSSQFTAQYKAALVEGDTIVDLTGGLGVDFSFMAQGRKGIYVERQKHLCDIARHNFAVLGLDACVVNGDGVEHLRMMEPVDTIYIDPARRDNAGNRVFALGDCTPDVSVLAPLMLQKAGTVIIKLSPMLDHRTAVGQLPCVEQVHIVSTRGECKELLLVLKRGYTGDVTVHCVNDDERMHFVLGEENSSCKIWDEFCPINYLYEPNASIMKAGSYNLIASQMGLDAVSADSHLLVGDMLVDDFPGRSFAIDAIGSMNKKELKQLLRGIKKANVAVRNFPLKANELAKRLKLADGGDVFIFGTTTTSGKHIIVRAHKTYRLC
ncbi:MAG: SAM-dependent methyltransferase [Muribaculaceae bacterium]|nr:SAM-dependent methyltransferase [Muribaculaceae bacterium]